MRVAPLLLLLACNPPSISDPGQEPSRLPDQPCLDGPDPAEIDFGAVDVGERAEASLVLGNACAGLLSLGGSVAGDAFALQGLSDIQAGSQLAFTLTFRPDTPGPVEGTLLLDTTDPDRRRVSIPLRGEGVGPALAVTPGTAALGLVDVGCEELIDLEVRNTGTDAATLTRVDLRSASAPELDLDLPALPLALEPDETARVSVIYRPVTGFDLEGELALLVDDPRAADTIVPLSGRGRFGTQAKDVFFPRRNEARDGLLLNQIPVVETLEVRVDEVLQRSGWRYEPSLQAVRFEDAFAPDEQPVEITYVIQPTCTDG